MRKSDLGRKIADDRTDQMIIIPNLLLFTSFVVDIVFGATALQLC